MGQYTNRVNIPTLNSPPLSEMKLISFGSLFGSGRVHGRSNLYREIAKIADESMVFRNELLIEISEEMVKSLGGQDGYVGLHLRVGDGPFIVSFFLF